MSPQTQIHRYYKYGHHMDRRQRLCLINPEKPRFVKSFLLRSVFRFAPDVAQRHIPSCANTVNKPKGPPGQMQQQQRGAGGAGGGAGYGGAGPQGMAGGYDQGGAGRGMGPPRAPPGGRVGPAAYSGGYGQGR